MSDFTDDEIDSLIDVVNARLANYFKGPLTRHGEQFYSSLLDKLVGIKSAQHRVHWTLGILCGL